MKRTVFIAFFMVIACSIDAKIGKGQARRKGAQQEVKRRHDAGDTKRGVQAETERKIEQEDLPIKLQKSEELVYPFYPRGPWFYDLFMQLLPNTNRAIMSKNGKTIMRLRNGILELYNTKDNSWREITKDIPGNTFSINEDGTVIILPAPSIIADVQKQLIYLFDGTELKESTPIFGAIISSSNDFSVIITKNKDDYTLLVRVGDDWQQVPRRKEYEHAPNEVVTHVTGDGRLIVFQTQDRLRIFERDDLQLKEIGRIDASQLSFDKKKWVFVGDIRSSDDGSTIIIKVGEVIKERRRIEALITEADGRTIWELEDFEGYSARSSATRDAVFVRDPAGIWRPDPLTVHFGNQDPLFTKHQCYISADGLIIAAPSGGVLRMYQKKQATFEQLEQVLTNASHDFRMNYTGRVLSRGRVLIVYSLEKNTWVEVDRRFGWIERISNDGLAIATYGTDERPAGINIIISQALKLTPAQLDFIKVLYDQNKKLRLEEAIQRTILLKDEDGQKIFASLPQSIQNILRQRLRVVTGQEPSMQRYHERKSWWPYLTEEEIKGFESLPTKEGRELWLTTKKSEVDAARALWITPERVKEEKQKAAKEEVVFPAWIAQEKQRRAVSEVE